MINAKQIIEKEFTKISEQYWNDLENGNDKNI